MSIQTAQQRTGQQFPKKEDSSGKDTAIRCPQCKSEAVYRYGRTAHGRQRYLCLMCNRQFSPEGCQRLVKNRPLCPKCRIPMHVYKREPGAIRFRCANYPDCRIFEKIAITAKE